MYEVCYFGCNVRIKFELKLFAAGVFCLKFNHQRVSPLRQHLESYATSSNHMIKTTIDGLQSAVEFIGPHNGCEMAFTGSEATRHGEAQHPFLRWRFCGRWVWP